MLGIYIQQHSFSDEKRGALNEIIRYNDEKDIDMIRCYFYILITLKWISANWIWNFDKTLKI